MTNKVAFFYLHGTDPLIARVGQIVGDVFSQPRLGLLTVPGINGITATWQDGSPRNDCFPNLLDPNIFEAKKIGYPALGFPMSVSLGIGITNLRNAIGALPSGQRWMVGGYSQGAAAASQILRDIATGGVLASRASTFLGGAVFGNPRRPGGNYRGEVGGTWSGAWDDPGSTTGGHGSFPTTGTYSRLTNAECDPTKWIELTEEGDIFSSTGDTPRGINWTEGNAAFIDLLNLPAILAAIDGFADIQAAFDLGGALEDFTDFVGRAFQIGGNGHAAYPWRPPPGDPAGGMTSYQIAASWLTGKANAYAVAPDVLPAVPTATSTSGWTTTLIPPAA